MYGKRVQINGVHLFNDDVLNLYDIWPSPTVIISDGGYGVSGFKGDAHTPYDLQEWYHHHIESWSRRALPGTTLWFWNTEIGWATVHPLLLSHGWEFVSCNVWNKGLQHIAGNCNLSKLKHFPIVTEVCVQYVKRAEFMVNGEVLTLKEWLRYEWERTKLPLYKANEACGVANAASRKYFTKDHLWYAPPPEHFARIVAYANRYGDPKGRPYFSINGISPLSKEEYEKLFPKFHGKYGVTNVWTYPPLHNGERIRLPKSTKYAHLNQKPLSLMRLIIEASSDKGDIIWEPFGGLCTAAVVALHTERKAYCAEIKPEIFEMAVQRLETLSKSDFESFSQISSIQETALL